MKNKYIDLKRVEFIITNKCSSKCIHCSNIDNKNTNRVIDEVTTKGILDSVVKNYKIDSVMTFGGESLLYPEITTSIFKYAKDLEIPNRQLITNCYWSKNIKRINEICSMLVDCGVNDLLLSVDSFHQEYLDFEIVDYTINKLSKLNFKSIKLHPCWFESKDSQNKYDIQTNNFLNQLSKYNIEISQGNILFPAGAAITNFPDKFKALKDINEIVCGSMPYTDNPQMVESICVNPDGKIGGLCYGEDMSITDFLDSYNPFSDKLLNSFLTNGIEELKNILVQQNVDFNIENYYSTCDACKALRKSLNIV